MQGRVDIDEALSSPVVAGVVDRYLDARLYPESQPYSGGVLDNWPAVDVDGFAICREEDHAIDEYLRWLDRPEAPNA